jgi:cytoskeletal protein CcmA (bactofilin family)
MLGNKKSTISVSGATTLVSRDTVVVGDLRFSGNVEVEGLVQGNILAQPDSDALVRVAGKGRVEGEIRAPAVIVNGEVKGDIHSSRHLELASKGRVQGNVYYNQLEMAAGSEVNGSLTHVADTDKASRKKADPSVSVVEAGEAARPGTVSRTAKSKA